MDNNERSTRNQGPLFERQRPQLAAELARDGVDFWADAEVISRYTRAQALADGQLVDCTTMAREAGFTFPVALSHAVWHDYVEPDRRSMGL